MPQVTEIAEILSADDLATLLSGYDRDLVVALLEKSLPSQYAAAQPYFTAAIDTFYRHPAADAPERQGLDIKDRQRCIVALQAGTGQTMPLAVHIYISLMEEITPHELAHVILLAGLYTGVPNFFTGFEVLAETLHVLKALAEAGRKDPRDIAQVIQAAFAPAHTVDTETLHAMGIDLSPDRPIRAF